MDRQNSQIILNEEYDTFGISKRLSIPYTSSLEAVAGALPNVVSSPIAPSAISSGQATAEIKQVQGVYYANKTSFSDTTAGYRFGIDTDGIAKFYFGDASGYIKWDGTTLTIAGLTGFIATGGAAADVNAYGTTINGGKITTGTITADKMSVSQLSAISADIGTITAGSITSATFRTAASGTRIELNTSGGTNAARLYDSSGVLRLKIINNGLAFYDSSGVSAGEIYGGTGEIFVFSDLDVNGDIIGATLTTDTIYGNLITSELDILASCWTYNFAPFSNDTYDLGTSSYNWNYLYVNKISRDNDVNVLDFSLSGRLATNQVFQFKNASGDPTGYEGGVYFNTTTNKLRVYAGGAWVDLH